MTFDRLQQDAKFRSASVSKRCSLSLMLYRWPSLRSNHLPLWWRLQRTSPWLSVLHNAFRTVAMYILECSLVSAAAWVTCKIGQSNCIRHHRSEDMREFLLSPFWGVTLISEPTSEVEKQSTTQESINKQMCIQTQKREGTKSEEGQKK